MDCFVYMKLNGVTFLSLKGFDHELSITRYIKPYNRRGISNNFIDEIYLLNGNKHHALMNELKIQRKRLKYLKSLKEREKQQKLITNTQKELRKYRKYHNISRKELVVNKKKIMERLVYIEELKYRIENDHRHDDDILKQMISGKLDELIDELHSDLEEFDENF